jgi:hypothetical protein
MHDKLIKKLKSNFKNINRFVQLVYFNFSKAKQNSSIWECTLFFQIKPNLKQSIWKYWRVSSEIHVDKISLTLYADMSQENLRKEKAWTSILKNTEDVKKCRFSNHYFNSSQADANS